MFRGVILAARGDEVLAHRAYGLGDRDPDLTTFCVMSISKTLCAATLMRLVQDGALELSDRVGEHLPTWPGPWQAVTIMDLATHSSAIPDLRVAWADCVHGGAGRGLDAWRAFAPRARDAQLLGAPGQQRRYSNFAYDLLGLVLEAAAARPYAELLHQHVLEPAGMAHTILASSTDDAAVQGLARDRDGALQAVHASLDAVPASIGVITTAADLHSFTLAILRGAILDRPTRDAMWTRRVGRQAIAWLCERDPDGDRLEHTGRMHGFASYVCCRPSDEVVVVVLSNLVFAPVERLGSDVARMVDGAAPPSPAIVPTALLDDCAGVYGDVKDHAMVVRRAGDALVLFDVFGSKGRCDGALLIPLGGGRFALPAGSADLLFEGLEDGPANHLVVQDDLAPGPSERLARTPLARDALDDAIGSYAIPGGLSVAVSSRAAGLVLTIPGAELALAPIARDRAIALLTDSAGSFVELDRDDDGRVSQLRWQQADGSTMCASRR